MKISKIIIVICILLSTMFTQACSRPTIVNVKKSIPIVKTFDSYIDGELMGFCSTSNPLVPILKQDRRIVFCSEPTLQTIVDSVDYPGEVTSYKIWQGLLHTSQSYHSPYLSIVCYENNSYRMIMYELTGEVNHKTPTVFKEVTSLNIKKVFDVSVDDQIILGYSYDPINKIMHLVCQSSDKKELKAYGFDGQLVSEYSLDEPTVFLENGNHFLDFIGTDGKNYLEFMIEDNVISKIIDEQIIDDPIGIDDIQLQLGPSISINFYPRYSDVCIIANNIMHLIWSGSRYNHKIYSLRKIKTPQPFISNLDHQLYNSCDGLHYAPQLAYDFSLERLILFKKSRKFLEGDFDLHTSAGNPHYICWFISEKKNNQSTLIKIKNGLIENYDYVTLYSYSPPLTSNILHVISDRDLNFVVITDDGVYQLAEEFFDDVTGMPIIPDDDYKQEIYIK